MIWWAQQPGWHESHADRYYKHFDELLPENNHLVVVVIFKMQLDKALRADDFPRIGSDNFIRSHERKITLCPLCADTHHSQRRLGAAANHLPAACGLVQLD